MNNQELIFWSAKSIGIGLNKVPEWNPIDNNRHAVELVEILNLNLPSRLDDFMEATYEDEKGNFYSRCVQIDDTKNLNSIDEAARLAITVLAVEIGKLK